MSCKPETKERSVFDGVRNEGGDSWLELNAQ